MSIERKEIMSKIPILFELMKKNKVTQQQLSEAVKVSQGNISDWKSGRSSPSIEVLPKIAEFFNVSSDYLLGLDDVPNRSTQLSVDKRRLLEMYDKLTDMEKGEILGELKMLTGDFPMTAAARSTDNSMPTKPNIDNLDDFPTMDEE